MVLVLGLALFLALDANLTFESDDVPAELPVPRADGWLDGYLEGHRDGFEAGFADALREAGVVEIPISTDVQ
jgi:hypothetical protein